MGATKKKGGELERLQAAVAELASEDGFRRWLQVRSAMHAYSLNNTILIAMQMPKATQVAGYRAWQKLGRQVRKGERGLMILAPRVRRVESEEDPDKKESRLVGFIGVKVFDVSQTDGEDLGAAPKTQPITGDSHADLLPKLEKFARQMGYTVEYSDELPGQMGGYCDSAAMKIVVAEGDANGKVATLVHEIAHGLGIGYEEYGRDIAEVIVEAATAIALGALGLETDLRSVPYIAGWAKGDAEQITKQAATIDKIARQITEAVEGKKEKAHA